MTNEDFLTMNDEQRIVFRDTLMGLTVGAFAEAMAELMDLPDDQSRVFCMDTKWAFIRRNAYLRHLDGRDFGSDENWINAEKEVEAAILMAMNTGVAF